MQEKFSPEALRTIAQNEAMKMALEEPAAAPPEGRDTGRVARWLALIASNLFDAGSTQAALNRGAVERNPLMKGIAKNPWSLFGVKAGVGVGEALLMDLVAKAGRRKEANIGAAAITGLNTAIGASNLTKGKK